MAGLRRIVRDQTEVFLRGTMKRDTKTKNPKKFQVDEQMLDPLARVKARWMEIPDKGR